MRMCGRSSLTSLTIFLWRHWWVGFYLFKYVIFTAIMSVSYFHDPLIIWHFIWLPLVGFCFLKEINFVLPLARRFKCFGYIWYRISWLFWGSQMMYHYITGLVSETKCVISSIIRVMSLCAYTLLLASYYFPFCCVATTPKLANCKFKYC